MEQKTRVTKLGRLLCHIVLIAFVLPALLLAVAPQAAALEQGYYNNITTGRQGGGSAYNDENFYIIGGYTSFPTTTNKVEAYNFSSGEWSTKANYPISASHMATEYYNGKIYCFGGRTNGTILDNTYVYNIAGNSWDDSKTAIPGARTHSTSFRIGGNIYVVGGKDSGGDVKDNVFCYDVSEDSWSEKTSIPTAIYDIGASVVSGGLAYVIGGKLSAGDTNKVQIYDPIGDSWSQGTVMPATMNSQGYGLYGGKIYCFGTSDYGKTVYVYDISDDSWDQGTDMLQARQNPSIAVKGAKIYIACGFESASNSLEYYDIGTATVEQGYLNNILTGRQGGGDAHNATDFYIIGGYSSYPTTTNKVEAYNFSSGNWSTKANYPQSWAHMTSQYYNGKIYCFGGVDSAGNRYENTYVYDIEGNSWDNTKTAMPTARSHAASFLIDDKIYVVGGRDAAGVVDNNECYDIVADSWSEKQAMPNASYDIQRAVSYQGKGYVIGGYNGSSYTNDVRIYDADGNSWGSGSGMPKSDDSMGCCLHGDEIYAFGGSQDMNSVYAYDISDNSWTQRTDMLQNRENPNVAIKGDRFYIACGFSSTSNSLEYYDLGAEISPSLVIAPENGIIGTQVTFTGSGFTPNAEVNIYYLVNTEWIIKISATDGNGGFTSDPYSIDNLHGSDIQFIALDQTTWIWSNVVHFIVEDISPPHIEIIPTTGSTNVVVKITGTLFTPNCSVSIFNQGMRFEQRVADSDGKFTTFFTIPSNTPLGPSEFIAYDHVSDLFSNEVFYTVTSQQVINPLLSIFPTSGLDNTFITFTGSDFTPSALVQIATRDSTGLIVTIAAPYTDNTGAFEITMNPWSVLGIAGGGKYLNFHALDTATGIMSNEVIFTRTAVLPTEGPAGSLVDLFLPFTGGDIATAGYLVGTFFFVAPMTIIGLAVVAAAKARQYAGLTVFGFFLLSVFICVMTSLYPWWFLVAIIAIVSLVFARGLFGRE